MQYEIIVSFRTKEAMNKYRRTDAKKHSWRSLYYKVIEIKSYSETSIAQAILCNDDAELWFVDTRDLLVINTEELMGSK